MKKLTIGLMAIIAIMSIQSINAQTADEIIDNHIAAMGGKQKLDSLKSVKKTGGLNVQGTDVGIVVTVLNGVGSRNDISVMSQEGYQIMTPAKGWNFMPFMGQAAPEEVSQDQVQSSQNLLDLPGLLYNYKEKGSQVELLGKENVDTAECYKIKLTNKAGKVYTMFIDAKTWYLDKVITKAYNAGQAEDAATTFLDFKKTDSGYIFPFSMTTPRGTIVYTSIETNVPVDEKIFSAN